MLNAYVEGIYDVVLDIPGAESEGMYFVRLQYSFANTPIGLVPMSTPFANFTYLHSVVVNSFANCESKDAYFDFAWEEDTFDAYNLSSTLNWFVTENSTQILTQAIIPKSQRDCPVDAFEFGIIRAIDF